MKILLIKLFFSGMALVVIWMVVDIVKSANLKDIAKKADPKEKLCKLTLFLRNIPEHHDLYDVKIYSNYSDFICDESTTPAHYYLYAVQGSMITVYIPQLELWEDINVPNQITFDITHLIGGER